MYTTDFSRTPPQGRGAAVLLAEGRSAARRHDGVLWRTRVRDGSIRAELLVFDTVAAAERAARQHAGRTRVLEAEERGYSNGVWRAEDARTMATNDRFHPVSEEEAGHVDPPEVPGGVRRPTGRPPARRPRRWTLFDTESLFLGATRYRHPLAWLVTNHSWWRMVAKMERMSGTVWHGIYWEFPFTLGTIASYRSRDDMLRFARMPEHRRLMQWIVKDRRNATGGFIRLYASRAELDRQAAVSAGSAVDVSTGSAVDASAGTPPSSSPSTPPPLVLEIVETEAQFQEFLALPRRSEPAALAVPLLESTARGWRTGSRATTEPVELVIARRGDEAVGRTTIHADPALDEKLDTHATLFGATWAAGPEDLRDLLDAIAARGAEAGSTEILGPVSLLPNQTGGVIASNFRERGFIEGAWNHPWVPEVYLEAGFEPWNESDTWIARFDWDDDPPDAAATTAPSAAELSAAGIRIRRASRLRFAREVRTLRTLVNAAFAQLSYYTEISPAQMRAATDGLVALMDPGLWLTAVDERTGEPVAFALLIPDATTVLQESGGRVGPRQIVRLLRATGRRGRDAILVIHGVVPERQGRGIGTLLWRQLGAHLRERRYGAVRSTYIGRDNAASARQLERLGGEPLHATAFYRRRLDGAGTAGRAATPRQGSTT